MTIEGAPQPNFSTHYLAEESNQLLQVQLGQENILFSCVYKISILFYFFLFLTTCMIGGVGLFTIIFIDVIVGSVSVGVAFAYFSFIFCLSPTRIEVYPGAVKVCRRLPFSQPVILETTDTVERVHNTLHGRYCIALYRQYATKSNRILLFKTTESDFEPLYNSIASQLRNHGI